MYLKNSSLCTQHYRAKSISSALAHVQPFTEGKKDSVSGLEWLARLPDSIGRFQWGPKKKRTQAAQGKKKKKKRGYSLKVNFKCLYIVQFLDKTQLLSSNSY